MDAGTIVVLDVVNILFCNKVFHCDTTGGVSSNIIHYSGHSNPLLKLCCNFHARIMLQSPNK